jgi:hypothetical protein
VNQGFMAITNYMEKNSKKRENESYDIHISSTEAESYDTKNEN